MRYFLAARFQDYHDGVPFTGRSLFGAAARAAELAYRAGYFLNRIASAVRPGEYRPRAAVVGIGSPVVGGTGKTPLVEYIAGLLHHRGRRVVILTRGYGRRSAQRVVIAPGQSEAPTVEETGDEPLMLARRLPGVMIVVDRNRAHAARDVERQSVPDAFVLDDAAPDRGVPCDRIIFTVAPADLTPPFRLLPAGRWREPATRLREPDAVALIGSCGPAERDRCTTVLRRLGFTGPVAHFVYEMQAWRNLDGNPTEFSSPPETGKVGAFCGLARPAAFFRWLEAQGIRLAMIRRFADHYPYQARDMRALETQAQRAGVELLITSEKDAAKMARFTELRVRIIYPSVRLAPRHGAEAFAELVETIGDRNGNH